VIAKKSVEAASERFTGITWFSEAPLSKSTTDIAEVTEELTQKWDVCWDGHLLIGADILVVTNRRVSRVEASHEDASRWGADRAAAVVALEANAGFSELIDVWCGEASLAKAGNVSVAKVIGEEKDDVWAAGCTFANWVGTGEHGVGCS
jgi:hypothetical protein